MDTTMNFEVLSVRWGGAERPFAYPNTGNMGAHVRAILTGATYPIFRLSSYIPEVVVDIGANVGAAALWFLRSNPEARVFCFEPSKFNTVVLNHNLAKLPNVTICPWGLADETRTAALYQGVSQCMQASTFRSIETSGKSETIELRSAAGEFDRLGIEHASILKIDTEGCELPILQSLESRLGAVDQLYVEYHSEDDRVAIDRMLVPRFVLAFAASNCVHRGVNLYIRRDLADAEPAWQALRIG